MSIVHVAVYDQLADWEPGHLLAELRTGRLTGVPFEVVSVAATDAPITTMGGLRVTPDRTLEGLDPAESALLVLPGAEGWEEGTHAPFAKRAGAFLEAGVPVAAICGATFGLAAAGLLDTRRHTSAAPEYLGASGYAGGDRYVDARAVADGGLVTAGPGSPVPFASTVLGELGLLTDDVRDAYEGVFGDDDRDAYDRLVAATS